MSSATWDAGQAGAQRSPGLIHAAILLVTSGLTVLVTAILGPSLPAMQAHFQGVARADYLVPLTMTTPMLMMAGLSIVAGALADRFGRKRMLVTATTLYAAFGTAPMWLDSLPAIIGSRVALGITEAFLMTISTTMIGDYYSGKQRAKLMSLQTTIAAGSAFVLNNLGGIIAEHGWRAPYAVYAISLVLAPLMVVFLWEPKPRSDEAVVHAEDVAWRPGLLVFVCALTLLLGIVFLTVPVHFGYLFEAIAVKSPQQIGVAYGLNSLGVISGTLVFGWIMAPRLPVALQLTAGCFVAGLGFVLMRPAASFGALAVAGVLNGFGAGILLPTMVTWCMRILPFRRRGVGTGAFQSCLFLGMFSNPLLVVSLEKVFGGSRAAGVAAIGVTLGCLGVVALLAGIGKARSNQ